MAKNVYEIFEEFEKAQTREEKIDVLRRNNNHALYHVLKLAYHPDAVFLIDRVPYYKSEEVPPGMSYSSIHQELDRVYLILKDHPRCPPTLTQERREQLFIQMLEALEAKEAVVFMNMVLKDLKVPGLDASIVREAFPGIIPD